MIIVDRALKAREEQGKPIRVGLIGAGFMGQGLTNQIVHSVPGMRMAAIYNRKPERALNVYRYAGCEDVRSASNQADLDQAIGRGLPVVAEDPYTICRSPGIDVVVDVTGSVEFGARIILDAFAHGKPVVLMNAEVDSTIGPILRVHGKKHGQILSACDGDEDLPVLLPVDAKDGPDGGVDLGVHQHHGLAVSERVQDDPRSELDRAGDVDDDVDPGRAADRVWVFRDDGQAAPDRLVEVRLVGGGPHVLAAGVAVYVERPLRLAVVDRGHPHAGNAVDDLVGESLSHETSADQADADRFPLLFSGPQRPVDDDHGWLTRSSCASPRARLPRGASRRSPWER